MWTAGSRHHTSHQTCFSKQLQNKSLPFFITFITPLQFRGAPPHFLSTSLTYRNFYFINHSVCLLDTTMLLIQILTNNSNFFHAYLLFSIDFCSNHSICLMDTTTILIQILILYSKSWWRKRTRKRKKEKWLCWLLLSFRPFLLHWISVILHFILSTYAEMGCTCDKTK